MKAGVLFAQNDIRYTDVPDPVLTAGHIMVRVHACGICGSDIPRVLGTEAHSYPIILGHEFSGEVVEVAQDVNSVKPGDKVAGVPLIPCMRCADCERGAYAQCKNYSFIGSREQGAFAEYVALPACNAVKLGSDVSYVNAALLEPAAVALHGILRADFQCGGDVIILGAGNIGIFLLQWARIFGAKSITVADVADERLKLAGKLGADDVINPLDKDFLRKAFEITRNRGFSYVFETAGQPAAIQSGFDLVANHGMLTCVGTPHKDFQFGWKQWEQINRKEFKLTGTWMSYSAPFPGEEWRLSAEYFGNHDIAVTDDMIFGTFPLSEIAEVFKLYETQGTVKGKIIIEV